MRITFAQFSLAALLFASFSTFATAGEEIIVDNKDADFKGNWQTSAGSTQKYKADYRFSSSTDSAEANSTAEFRPKIANPGRYDVDIWYAPGDNRSIVAPVTVVGKSGKATFKVDQKKNGGKWVNVAKGQDFDSGTSGFVLIGNNTGSTGSVVVADAIRLVYTGSGEPGNFSLTFSPSTGGTLSKEPNKPSFAEGSDVQLTATPDEGYIFTGWTGDVTGVSNPITVAMSKDKTVGAIFVQGGVGAIVEASEAVLEGTWQEGSKQWGKPFSNPYFWTSGGQGSGKKSATFTPDLPRAGLYDIYVWFVPGANRSRTSPFEISTKAGKEVVKMNQQTGGDSWVLLAPGKQLEAGKNNSVRLSNDVEEPSAVVVADAIAFVYVGASKPSDTAKQ